MAGVLHMPSSPSYEVPEFFWAVPQGCPRQPVLYPAMMKATNNHTANLSSTGVKNTTNYKTTETGICINNY